MLEVCSDDEGCDPELPVEDHTNQEDMDSKVMGISLQALTDFIPHNTIELLGKVNKTLLTILVDSGSTTSFLDTSVAQATECTIEDTTRFKVSVANGDFVESIAVSPSFKWWM